MRATTSFRTLASQNVDKMQVITFYIYDSIYCYFCITYCINNTLQTLELCVLFFLSGY